MASWRSLWTCAAATLASVSAPSGAAAESNHQLTVQITGIRNADGQVAVALFNSGRDFPEQAGAHAGQLTPARKGTVSVTFKNLRPGIYAVAVLHDENKNGKMDFNLVGMPTEGYGFSNDASAPFGPPSFDEAAFKLKVENGQISIAAKYFL